MDRRGNIYGSTVDGGTTGEDGGTVFKLTSGGKEKVLYSFCSQPGCTDGDAPFADVVRDSDGNIYGTTLYGGANNAGYCYAVFDGFCGTVFKIGPTGKETVLYSFCAKAYCADGAGPEAGVVLDKDGNLYGTTAAGGNHSGNCPNSMDNGPGWCGVAFELQPDLTETVLQAFCSQANCTDGALPFASVTLKYNKSGITLYGTAEAGGAKNDGVVYSLSGRTEKVLHSFCNRANCTDGAVPQSGVISVGGYLFGTTLVGGKGGAGTIYKLAR